jgi:superfamily II DNA or RNA helicase
VFAFVDPVNVEALIVVNNRIRIRKDTVPEDAIRSLQQEFEHSNPEFFKRKALGFYLGNTPKEIKTWTEEHAIGEHWLSLPRGGLARVRKVLDDHEVDRHFDDQRTSGESVDIPDHKLTPYPFQERLITAALEKGTCLLRAPTAAGKTCIAFAIASRLKLRTLVVVPNRAILDQWVRRADKELGLKKKQIGIIQGSRFKIENLTIAMAPSLAAKGVGPELARAFGLVLFDEVQRAPASSFFAAIDPFFAKYRIGVSADHRRKDGKEFMTVDLFGPVAAEVTRKELIEQGYILDVQVRVVPTEFRADWYGRPDENPDDEEAGKALFETPEKEIDTHRLYAEMADNDARNKLALEAVTWGVKEQNEITLVMSHRREHCRLLDLLIVQSGILRTGFLIGGEGEDHRAFERTVTQIEAGELDVAVGTFQAIGTGLDLPKAAVCVAAMPIASNRYFFNQVRGRICRAPKGKKGAWMVYLWDQYVFGDEHVRNLFNWNRNVVVLDHGKWVDAKTWLRARRVK